MRDSLDGAARLVRTILAIGILSLCPLAAADDPGASESTPAEDNTGAAQNGAHGPPEGPAPTEDTTAASGGLGVGPGGQPCRPACL